MRNIILFIRRFFVLAIFLILQGLSLAFLVNYNKTYEALFADKALEVTGFVSKQYNELEYFFKLRRTNRQLQEENTRLHNMLKANFEGPDTSYITRTDTSLLDTLSQKRVFTWLPAKVVGNSLTEENNYITLFRGSEQGVTKDMAVVGPEGVVGKVIFVNANYCRVMSLLNRYSKVSVILKKNNEKYSGIVEWDGKEPNYITLRNVPKSIEVKKGDSVLTSYMSGNFPPGLMVGTVDEIRMEQASNFYSLRLKTATNFYSLEVVYLVGNKYWGELKSIEGQTLKN